MSIRLNKILIAGLYVFFGSYVVLHADGSSQRKPPVQNNIQEFGLEELWELKPLPKIHYSWGFPSEFLDRRNDRLLYEFARLTHSLTVGTSPNKKDSVLSSRIDNAVYTCARINKTDPEIPCTIAFAYSPWHWKFLQRKPITKDHNSSIFTDPTYKIEIDEFVQQMTFLKDRIRASNRKYESDIKISAILLDCERFSPRRKDLNWNKAMAKALDDIHIKAVRLFPGARIEWYMRGMGGYTEASLSKWYSYFTGLEEYIPSLSYSHYVVSDPEFMHQVFLKTCELADSLDVHDVTPWLGLAWGRKRNRILRRVTYEAWDYDAKYSYQTGLELNDLCDNKRPDNYPPFNRAKVVILYTPFDPNISAYGKHFIEYCRGAAHANRQ